MQTQQDLQDKLLRLDGRGYKAYKQIKGSYTFPDYTFIIDHVQGDPFAAPSRVRIQIPQSIASFPEQLYRSRSRRTALADFITRQFDRQAREKSRRRGTGNSGIISIDRPGQEVLERTSAFVNDQQVELRCFVGLPAQGRGISGHQAVEVLCEDLPVLVERTLKFHRLDRAAIQTIVETVEDADAIRAELQDRKLIAFVADGALLPRSSGIDSRPLSAEAVLFQSPAAFRVIFHRPNLGPIHGMGIPHGVTLIVGGGYHGKSTLLRAIERGVYNHIPGDGREFVITDPDAVKIRAEDGRRVVGVDISPFINNLPQKRSTTAFSTENASGSTSQAANIIEALEMKAKCLLIDEDTTATNFMIRDHRMQELIAKEREPITPFIDKVRQLYTDHGISTVLVIGGSGDYFETADTVIALENFRPQDVTERAREIARKYADERTREGGPSFGNIRHRIPLPHSLDPRRGSRGIRLKAPDAETIAFGSERIDLSSVEQIVEKSQVRAIAHAMAYAKSHYVNGHRTLLDIVELIMEDIQEKGLDRVASAPYGDLVRFRRFEWAAAVNRLRTLAIR
ncbi:MAG: ABC-ATPase domain-containing protein [Nitrospira sp.]|nr:ATPase [Candidatus Manganitrophaceae bacterium]HIL35048.1 ATPase [Candidatus Manganitrophaceae bacterium]